AARPFKLFDRHPPLLLSPFPGPFTGLFTGRFPRRLFDRLFQEPPRLPRRRFVHRRSSAPQRLFDLAARLEQVVARLLARLALERLGARLHLPLASAADGSASASRPRTAVTR